MPVLDAAIREQYQTVVIPRYKHEVKFLLAFNYFELYKRYGAVPLVQRLYKVEEMETLLRMQRSPADSVADYIVKLCDEAAAGLPLNYNDQPAEIGRITKGAALCLKAKTLLYAASPCLMAAKWTDNRSV
ncbi:hypothetical protein MKQ70_13880 [Chitinophaga sedimenti]|uniref:RagB/SusD family nutrient uptake outer membrane protein n=1 Tax=Chitinophaga sedimenti TaxID=2033606 RepID=UPI002005AD99|nr:RagB/SusD family nutrient uptake outer membrane protein [Chitinophaga sedimenti]MCK7556050.1 hypothetical protein [Chitinophaga sedimenti]